MKNFTEAKACKVDSWDVKGNLKYEENLFNSRLQLKQDT